MQALPLRIIGGIHPKKRWQSCSDVGTLMILIRWTEGRAQVAASLNFSPVNDRFLSIEWRCLVFPGIDSLAGAGGVKITSSATTGSRISFEQRP